MHRGVKKSTEYTVVQSYIGKGMKSLVQRVQIVKPIRLNCNVSNHVIEPNLLHMLNINAGPQKLGGVHKVSISVLDVHAF